MTFLATVTWPGPSNLSEDQIVNTWHFDGGGSNPENVVDMLDDFYTTVPSGGGSTTISSFMTTEAVQDDFTFRLYDLSDPMPRIPTYEVERAVAGIGTGASLPREVAVCMSYQGTKISGVNQARRRGRVYLGGLKTTVMGGGAPSSAFCTLVAAKGEDLLAASIASVSWSWVVYSPTSSSSTPVTNGWCDDAFDTQRRRGIRATERKVFP